MGSEPLPWCLAIFFLHFMLSPARKRKIKCTRTLKKRNDFNLFKNLMEVGFAALFNYSTQQTIQ
jgi:hypothetical protein